MIPKVFILTTCRNPDLVRATTLVFDTLRVGFPTAEVTVYYNKGDHLGPVRDAARAAKVNREFGDEYTHHEWVLMRIEHEEEPFFICDTDIVFWESFERFSFEGAALAGRYTPQFYCRFANAVTRSRLHTCLLYVDPVRVKEAVTKYAGRFPDIYCCPRPTLQDLVFPRYTPQKFGNTMKTYFNDTCSFLYQAFGGKMFTDEQNFAFDHVQHATLLPEVAPTYPNGNMVEFQAAVFDNPSLLKGQWKRDLEYYRSRYAE